MYKRQVERARREAERLVADGNESYDRSVAEGLEEQQRLVSEAEVTRRADEEAHRIVESAHAESSRLRGECDDYVDGKLAEFEETLSGVLRTVTSDRSALRQGPVRPAATSARCAVTVPNAAATPANSPCA